MNDVQMTIAGNVVDTPKLRRTKGGHYVASFRVASTPRRFDRETNAWVDGATLFVTVTCWHEALCVRTRGARCQRQMRSFRLRQVG